MERVVGWSGLLALDVSPHNYLHLHLQLLCISLILDGLGRICWELEAHEQPTASAEACAPVKPTVKWMGLLGAVLMWAASSDRVSVGQTAICQLRTVHVPGARMSPRRILSD